MLSSVTAVFPAYNDAGTIARVVETALEILPQVAGDYEVVVVDDGSEDGTAEVLAGLAARENRLRVVTHARNRGYGAALRRGFAQATRDWIFYTDGDGQYDPRELARLAEVLGDHVDVANGYKIARQDSLHRVVLGRLYHHAAKWLFGLPVRDTDCDFRLFRRSLLARVQLESGSGTLPVELVKKFHDAGARFVEVPIHHYPRTYGRSQFFRPHRLLRTAVELVGLWWKLHI